MINARSLITITEIYRKFSETMEGKKKRNDVTRSFGGVHINMFRVSCCDFPL